jgi:sugar-specific transcriptional regulator TrmB
MEQIPQPLIDSLMELGLLESEAKIYTAIVLLRRAGVKDLIKFLSLSKPSIYAGIRSLEDRGIVMLMNQKPATYQALPPDVALDVLMRTHQYHKEKSLHLIQSLENEFYQGNPSASLWYTLESKNVEAKIRDMLGDAKEKVICCTSEKYLHLIESNALRTLSFKIVIMSNDKTNQQRLEHIFKNKASIHTVRKTQMINFFAAIGAGDQEDKKQSMLDQLNMMDIDNLFVLIIDDSECLAVPLSLPSNPRKVMVTKNKAMISNIKLLERMLTTSE